MQYFWLFQSCYSAIQLMRIRVKPHPPNVKLVVKYFLVGIKEKRSEQDMLGAFSFL
jgi:hypothetical protein